MYALEFTQDDVNANREGQLSSSQRERIQADVAAMRKQSRLIIWVFVIFFAALGIAVGFYLYLNSGRTLDDLLSLEMRTLLAALAGLMLVLFILVVFMQLWDARRLDRASVRPYEGKAQLVTWMQTRHGPVRVYNVVIRRNFFFRKTFRFRSDLPLSRFQDGVRYRVYYLSYTIPLVLSIEEAPEKEKRGWFKLKARQKPPQQADAEW